jgi:hypothetical protein
VYANLTDDQSHLNKFVLPLRSDVEVESLTFRSSNEDWGLLLAAMTMEAVATDVRRWTGDSSVAAWSDLPGWLNVKKRREADGDAMELFAPSRFSTSVADGHYEVELTLSGDPEGCPRLRIENAGYQVLADYCLSGGGQHETIRFFAQARDGKLTLDFIPGQNYATGSLFPEKGFTGQYGAWWSPDGNFTRIENIHLRATAEDHTLPPPSSIHYGWLLPGASAETLHGLIVDHEDADGNSATTMKWKAGGFRADVPNGRYKLMLHHSTYAPLNTVVIDLFANGKQVCHEREVADEVFEFTADVTEGFLQIEWRQPRTHSRVPRYAIRGIIFERIA